jgi:hypothetical protein
MDISIRWRRRSLPAPRDAGAEVSLWQVPELIPDEISEKSGARAARAAFAHVEYW